MRRRKSKRLICFHFTAQPPNMPFAAFVGPLNKDKETNERIKRRVQREAYLARLNKAVDGKAPEA